MRRLFTATAAFAIIFVCVCIGFAFAALGLTWLFLRIVFQLPAMALGAAIGKPKQ